MTEYNEYNLNEGSLCYYYQNKPGSDWYDKVNNNTGWVVDFSLKVNDVINSDNILSSINGSGSGIYLNDGKYQETINFFSQEIFLSNSGKNAIYDTTSFNDYRISGRNNNIKIFAKKSTESSYEKIIDTVLVKKSEDRGNSFKPSVFEDISGKIHAVWWDDGSGYGRIFYSLFDGSEWSTPECILNGDIDAKNPTLLVSSSGKVYVSFEYSKTNEGVIGFVYRDSIGWSSVYDVGSYSGNCKSPAMCFDSDGNVCIVWSDDRDANYKIYLRKFLSYELLFSDEFKISYDNDSCYNPSISSYLDNIVISWTYNDRENEKKIIKSCIYHSSSNIVDDSFYVSDNYLNADNSCVLVNYSGKIFYVWNDNIDGKYKVYVKILNMGLSEIYSQSCLMDNFGGARYPKISENISNGDVYISCQDYKSDYVQFNDEYGNNEEYFESPYYEQVPLSSSIYLCVYKGGEFLSSCLGEFDVNLSFKDDRNCFYPCLPSFFNNELPVIYQTNIVNEYYSLTKDILLSNIALAFYDLSRDDESFEVNYGGDNDPYGVDRDYLISKEFNGKEIRFGNFSNTINSHYCFKNIQYYLGGISDPYSVKEISSENYSIDNLSSITSAVNNYGDIWFAGTCGFYFYVSRQNRVIKVDPDGEILGASTVTSSSTENEKETERSLLKNIKSISFDSYGNMFYGGENSLFRGSINPMFGAKNISLDISSSEEDITSICVTSKNILFIGTTSGIYIYDSIVIDYDSGDEVGDFIITRTNNFDSFYGLDNYPSGYINCIEEDSNGCIWIGTNNGLYRYFKGKFIKFGTEIGLSSMIINDIAIRNSAIRYLATSNGIVKMVGFSVDKIINSSGESIWNNNVKSILWQSPNIIFAGTLSNINQISLDDDNDTYTTLYYSPSDNLNYNPDDLNVYYLVGENSSISESDIVDVYINGNLVKHGYVVGYRDNVIRFECPMNNDDIVEVVVRKDLEVVGSFSQGINGKDVDGNVYRVGDIVVKGGNIYSSVYGDKNGIRVNDSNSIVPYDRVILDTSPPTFLPDSEGVKISEQINKDTVRIGIDGATDSIYDSNGNVLIQGSGIESMVISNYENFTTDGDNEQTPVPYSSTYIHNLGISLDDVVKQITFSDTLGSCIKYIEEVGMLLSSSSASGNLYIYSFSNQEWEKVFEYEENSYIDAISYYNGYVLVGVGSDTGGSNLYIYNQDGNSLSEFNSISISESRIWSMYLFGGKVYISTGNGYGNEYVSGSGNGGSLYVFNDGTSEGVEPYVSKIIDGLDSDIFDMVSSGNNNILACTGQNGYIYEIDVENAAAFIVYNSDESLTSICRCEGSNSSYIFVGGEESGKIRRSIMGENSYNFSFSTVPGKVSSLDNFYISTTNNGRYLTAYAAIGKNIYYLSSGGSWTWRYSHNEDINDIAYDSSRDVLYVISDSNIKKINPLLESKTIYLKLIDRAGNETTYDSTISVDANKFSDSISISDLTNFVNSNQLIQIDSDGNTIYNLNGDSNFYSGKSIDSERGEYVSEIFDGTNDLVKWESFSWEAVELNNTEVDVYIRSSTSKNDILLGAWSGPYKNYQSGGIDLSAFSGQYFQFKAVLRSSVKGITPSFERATIRAVTGEAIHFYTTNFVLSDRLKGGILTSQKIVPVSADIVFGINTTNSVDWNDYQIVDENRIFSSRQVGENMRIGIKLISPNRSIIEPESYGEYGPYDSNLYFNTVDFSIQNNLGESKLYNFKVSFYDDYDMSNEVVSFDTRIDNSGFSVNGESLSSTGYSLNHNETGNVIFSVPSSAIDCGEYYFIKIEYFYDDEEVTYSSGESFISSCTSSFIDDIIFDFTNDESFTSYYHFRIKFYSDPERTMEYKTIYSGNDIDRWFIDGEKISEDGVEVTPDSTVEVMYSANHEDFESGTIYYLEVEAYDGSDYVFSDSSYTFQIRDVVSEEYCGEYGDVPIVKNFAIMFELDNDEFLTLNI